MPNLQTVFDYHEAGERALRYGLFVTAADLFDAAAHLALTHAGAAVLKEKAELARQVAGAPRLSSL